MSDQLLFILCGPSGVGKTTLARHLLGRHRELTFSVSYTTRPRRDGEVDGKDYHFVDEASFAAMREEGGFAEWASVHGNYYGTAIATIERAWQRGQNVIFDIDYQGALQLRERFGKLAVTVLVSPPSMAELEERLRARRTDSSEVIERRLEKARREIEELKKFADYEVVNDDLDDAKDRIDALYARSTR